MSCSKKPVLSPDEKLFLITVKDLCSAGEFQSEFLKHSPCLDRVRPSYEVCASQYQNTMTLISQQRSIDERTQEPIGPPNDNKEDVRNICCSFRQYLDCSEHAARRICGESTGKFIRGFLDRMGNSLIKMYCNEYKLGTEKCYGYASSVSTMGLRFSTVLAGFLLLILLR